jgi:signal transduction histidine kinase
MKFDYNPRILEQLGKELITSDEVAFTELLKNSFDARASIANVHFFDSIKIIDDANLINPVPKQVIDYIKTKRASKCIIVEDDGKGMTTSELEKGFFTVGTNIKEREKEEQLKKDLKDKIILGDKGLGRLAAQRLGNILIVETTSLKDKAIHFTFIEWDKFFKDKNEDAPVVELNKVNKGSYTRLWFIDNVSFDNFIEPKNHGQLTIEFDGEFIKAADYDLKDKLYSTISFLSSPFEELEDNFSIKFFINNERIDSKFHNESIKIAQTIHSFKVKKERNKTILHLNLELQPWYLELIHLRLIGSKPLFEKYKRSHSYYSKLLKKNKDRFEQKNLTKSVDLKKYLLDKKFGGDINLLLELFPIEGQVYSFYRDNYRYNLIINAAEELKTIQRKENIAPIKEFLNINNGIKLYRDNYRIANLGDKDNDWLNLQQERTKGQQFFRFELGNVIGYIKISDFYQKNIKETSSRQGLKESPSSKSLLEFLRLIVNDEFHLLSTTAYYLTRDILFSEPGLIPESNPQTLKTRVNESEKLLQETRNSIKAFQRSMTLIRQNIDLDTDEKKKKIQAIFSELESKNQLLADNITHSIGTLDSAKEAIILIEEKQKEAYNNYKLMANGLITEVMTHELHSILLNSKGTKDHKMYVEDIKKYLIDTKQPKLYKNSLMPLDNKLDFLQGRMTDLDHFYHFLEKTFIKQGTHEDFAKENLNSVIEDFSKRFEKRLKEVNTTLKYDSLTNSSWYVPKGTLTHLLYNLIDNSTYWISERQRRAAYDDLYVNGQKDFIYFERLDGNSMAYYDSGTGVLPQYCDTLFHPFISGKKEGRGMGLYIVKNLLESFNGRIELLPDQNEYGNRYKFIISIQPYESK